MVNKGFQGLKKVNILNTKYYKRKMKSPFIVYVDFQSKESKFPKSVI